MKNILTFCGAFALVVALAGGLVWLTGHFWPKDSVSMNIQNYRACFAYSNTNEIECFKNEYYLNHREEILNKHGAENTKIVLFGEPSKTHLSTPMN